MRRSARFISVAAVLLGFALAFAFTPPRGPRSMRQFDAARMADLELRMWKAYYAKERTQLFALLVMTLHEQYHYSWAKATAQAFHLARAAARFGDWACTGDGGRSDPCRPPSPIQEDLESAYAAARSWLGAGFDPRAVARAELAWWVARRTAGENSAEHVGQLMTQEYALLYETAPERVASAALLRATAAKLRDEQAAHPDWDRIGSLLQASYRELLAALSTENV
jgi:hypothetical protein